jgi:hypothetical protein
MHLQMTKSLIILSLVFSSILACNQSTTTKKVSSSTKDEYTLPIPLNWETETFPIPISFAPSIPYTGVEDIRFAPGWAKASSNQYWSYAFLWQLQNNPTIDNKTIETNLQAYYTGLINSNIEKNKVPKEKIIPTTTKVEKTETSNGDSATYKGTIYMFDYMKQQPITLNCIVHVKYCPNQNSTYLFHEISPKPITDSVWTSLHQIWAGFECKK